MDTQFVTIDPPEATAPGSKQHHVVLVGEASGNTELMADALGVNCSVELVSTADDIDCLLAAPGLVSVAVVDATSVSGCVRSLISKLRDNGVPALLLTPQVKPTLRRYAVGRDGFDVLEKPIRRAELRDAVSRLSRN